MNWSNIAIRTVERYSLELQTAWEATYLKPASRPYSDIPIIAPESPESAFKGLSGGLLGFARQWLSLQTYWRQVAKSFDDCSPKRKKRLLNCAPGGVQLVKLSSDTSRKGSSGSFPCKHKMCPSCHFRRTVKLADYVQRCQTKEPSLQFALLQGWSFPFVEENVPRRKLLKYIFAEDWREKKNLIQGKVVGRWIFTYPVFQQPVIFDSLGKLKDLPPEWRLITTIKTLISAEEPDKCDFSEFPFPSRYEIFGTKGLSAVEHFMEYPYTWYIGPKALLSKVERVSRGLHELKLWLGG